MPAFFMAIIPDRESQTGGHPWPHFSMKQAVAYRKHQKAYFRPRLTLLYFWLLSLKRPL